MFSPPARITPKSTAPTSLSVTPLFLWGEEEPQTSFLFRQFVFPNARPFTISACFALPSPRSGSRRPDPLHSNMFVSLIDSLRVPPVTDSHRFAAGPQSPVVGHPFLEQLEPRRPAEPRQAAGPQLPFPGMEHQQVRKRSSSLLAAFGLRKEVVMRLPSSCKNRYFWLIIRQSYQKEKQ